MKTLLRILFLFASACAFSQNGVSTASLQGVQNVKLDTISAREYRTARAFDVTGGNGVFWNSGYPISTYVAGINTAMNTSNGYLDGTYSRTLTVSSSTASSTGTISAGAKSVGIFTSSNFVGTINGITRNPNTFYSFGAQGHNEVLGTVTYSVGTGSITIDKVQ